MWHTMRTRTTNGLNAAHLYGVDIKRGVIPTCPIKAEGWWGLVTGISKLTD